jgi:hypothetical protein
METDDMLKNDFLAELIRQVPLDCPSDEFVGNVMKGLDPLPSGLVVKQAPLIRLKWLFLYAGLGLLIFIILYTSDIPYINSLFARDYLSGAFVTMLQPFLFTLKGFLASKFVSYTLLISVSAGFIFLIDNLLSRKLPAQHPLS